MKLCPVHKKKMEASKTKYGLRFQCPLCDYYCWSGNTSTPANLVTHRARMRAHREFDTQWETKKERRELYKALSEYMNYPQHRTHIGMFSIEECMKVLNFIQVQEGKKHYA